MISGLIYIFILCRFGYKVSGYFGYFYELNVIKSNMKICFECTILTVTLTFYFKNSNHFLD